MERNLRKERIGVVVSAKMDKTIVVAVERKEKRHRSRPKCLHSSLWSKMHSMRIL